MTPNRQQMLNAWQVAAIKTMTLIFPFLVASCAWVVTSVYSAEKRISVIEESRRLWNERFVENGEHASQALRNIDERLRRIEIRLGVEPK